MLRFYYPGLDPDTLTTKQWAEAIAYLDIIRIDEAKRNQQ